MRFDATPSRARWPRQVFWLCLRALPSTSTAALARINLVTLPGRDTVQLTIQNSKDIEVVLDVRRNFAGDWSLKNNAAYDKVDANKVKFVLPLKAREKRQFRYEVTANFGSNVTR